MISAHRIGVMDSLGCRGINCMDWAGRLEIGTFQEGVGLVQLVCVFGRMGIEWAAWICWVGGE